MLAWVELKHCTGDYNLDKAWNILLLYVFVLTGTLEQKTQTPLISILIKHEMILTFVICSDCHWTDTTFAVDCHSQSMTRKAVCLAANSKGNARLNENYFLVGLSFTSRFPSQTTLDEICWMPFVVVTFSPPSPSVQVRIFYQLPKELKYHTIGYNFSLIKSLSAQAEGPTYSWSTSYLSSEKAGQDKF